MATAKHKEILFVFHGKNQSKRSQELQDARRRAHAARQSARKNRDPLDVASTTSSSTDSKDVVEIELPDAPAQRGPVRRFPILPPFESILEEDDSGHLRSPVISPTCILSQGLMDPFQTTIVSQLPSVLQRYLHDAQTMIWPSMVPLVPREQATFFYRRSPIDTPTEIDHQIDAAAAITLQYIRPKDPATVNQIIAIGKEHRQRSINWVNDQIANANGPPESKVIAALLSLISHSGLKKPNISHKYPTTPLIMAEFASLFGSSRVLTEDVQFLHSVVEMKGGDDWVGSNVIDQDMPLRLMLNHFDIFISTRKGIQPMWKKIAAVPAEIMQLYSTTSDHSEYARTTCSGRGFSSSIITHPGLVDALETTRLTVNALESYRSSAPNAPSLHLLIHMRNLAQHRLLMLYPETDEPPQLLNFEAIAQSAALIFSDLVLFALSPASDSRLRLLTQLRESLQCTPWSACQNNDEVQLRLWALMMLGIGSVTRDVLDEYAVAELAKAEYSPALAMFEKPEVCEEMMRRFLWWDFVLLKPGTDVWMAAFTRRGQRQPRRSSGQMVAGACE